jgi:hypothetical protein
MLYDWIGLSTPENVNLVPQRSFTEVMGLEDPAVLVERGKLCQLVRLQIHHFGDASQQAAKFDVFYRADRFMFLGRNPGQPQRFAAEKWTSPRLCRFPSRDSTRLGCSWSKYAVFSRPGRVWDGPIFKKGAIRSDLSPLARYWMAGPLALSFGLRNVDVGSAILAA